MLNTKTSAPLLALGTRDSKLFEKILITKNKFVYRVIEVVLLRYVIVITKDSKRDIMGKGIIFVGERNLNRNKERQSMYNTGYHKQTNSNRLDFYKELCKESKKVPVEKVRIKKIEQLYSTYQNNACSKENMNKVFMAYWDCLQSSFKKKKDSNKKISQLPVFLAKNKVDKRIIKRIMEIEGLSSSENATKKIQKETIKEEVIVRKKEKIDRFHELLNQYLIENNLNSTVDMHPELKELLLVFKRDPDYIDRLKKIYHHMLSKNTSFDKIRRKHKLMIADVDKNGLMKQYYLYKIRK